MNFNVSSFSLITPSSFSQHVLPHAEGLCPPSSYQAPSPSSTLLLTPERHMGAEDEDDAREQATILCSSLNPLLIQSLFSSSLLIFLLNPSYIHLQDGLWEGTASSILTQVHNGMAAVW